MLVAAISDVHAPRYFDDFKAAISRLKKCDLLLFAGDIVSKSRHEQVPAILEAVREVYKGQIIACFGNEEYDQSLDEFKKFKEISWLNDESVVVDVDGVKVGVAGSRGSLDRPTFWQRTHVNEIFETYRKRVENIDSMLAELKSDLKIVISHYSPTYLTLEGERESSWPEMASKAMEEVIKKRQPDVWFHGHIHRSTKPEVEIGRTLVVDVALPARKNVTVVDLPRKTGLEKFV